MNKPLPPDVVARVDRDFGSGAEAVKAQLLACRRIGSSDFINDRVLRCIVFAARGEESRVLQLIELAREDFRDVIMAAEYDSPLQLRRRDFNYPFGREDTPCE